MRPVSVVAVCARSVKHLRDARPRVLDGAYIRVTWIAESLAEAFGPVS